MNLPLSAPPQLAGVLFNDLEYDHASGKKRITERVQKYVPHPSQSSTARRRLEQFSAQITFEFLDCAGQWRLLYVQPLHRPCEMQFVGYRNEAAQMTELHIRTRLACRDVDATRYKSQ